MSSKACETCLKAENELPNGLKRCAKCLAAWYCSRECQKVDWKKHKTSCGNTRADPTSMANNATSATSKVSSKAICYIPKPFTALDNGTWLHNRPKNDVFKLIVDTYRMRVEDQYKFEGDVDEGSLYSGASAASALRHFKRFLMKLIKLDGKRQKKLLPEWWSQDSLKECLDFANSDKFSNVGYATEKHDIQEHYAQMDMPMQLRMFSEKIDGSQAAGMSGESMLRMQVEIEKKNLYATHLSL